MTQWLLAYWHPLLFTLVGAPTWLLAGVSRFSEGGWILCVMAPVQTIIWWWRSYLKQCRLNQKTATVQS